MNDVKNLEHPDNTYQEYVPAEEKEQIKTNTRRFPWSILLLCLLRLVESGILFSYENSEYLVWVDSTRSGNYYIKDSQPSFARSIYSWLMPVLSMTVTSGTLYTVFSAFYTSGLLAAVLYNYFVFSKMETSENFVSKFSDYQQKHLNTIYSILLGLCFTGMDIISQIPNAFRTAYLLLVHVSFEDATSFLLMFTILHGLQLILLFKAIKFQKKCFR